MKLLAVSLKPWCSRYEETILWSWTWKWPLESLTGKFDTCEIVLYRRALTWPSKSNSNGLWPKLTSTTSPGVWRPTVGKRGRVGTVWGFKGQKNKIKMVTTLLLNNNYCCNTTIIVVTTLENFMRKMNFCCFQTLTEKLYRDLTHFSWKIFFCQSYWDNNRLHRQL